MTAEQMRQLEELAHRISRCPEWPLVVEACELGMRMAATDILGPACPCSCGSEPWHQRGVCRFGQEMLMKPPSEAR